MGQCLYRNCDIPFFDARGTSGIHGGKADGNRDYVPAMASAAMAFGAIGHFFEAHPDMASRNWLDALYSKNQEKIIAVFMREIKDYAVRCFQDEAQAILDLIPLLTDDFDKAIDLIYHGKGKLVVTGVGKSGHCGAKIAATLASTGTPSFFINPLDAFHGDLGMISSDDIVLAISNSGQTDELLRFIPFLKERDIPLIAMSGSPVSLLAKYADCHLNISVKHEACPLNLAPTSSTTATLAMGDALACALMRARNFQTKDFAQYHPGGSLGKRLLTHVRDLMRKDDLPIIGSDMRIAEALTVISDGRIGMAAVLNSRRLVGLVTDGDIRRTFQRHQKESFDMVVKDIMVTNPITVHEKEKIVDIEHFFDEKKVHTLIVLDDNDDFAGFIDYRDCMI